MIVRVNGDARDVAERTTVAAVLALLDVDRDTRGVAVAVDREVIPRAEWEGRRLTAGARVEVLSAIQGG